MMGVGCDAMPDCRPPFHLSFQAVLRLYTHTNKFYTHIFSKTSVDFIITVLDFGRIRGYKSYTRLQVKPCIFPNSTLVTERHEKI